eukprot:EC836180.1.p4 GENE.EC836180.1~~EC836180.1.p4  ORF type:complete len:111 (+),score=25.21 EC836180.1:1-333(+)
MLDAINMRFVQYFNTSPCDNLHCAWERAFQFNVTLPEVVALPEVDGWRYEKGPSIVCAGLVSVGHADGRGLRVRLQRGRAGPQGRHPVGHLRDRLDRPPQGVLRLHPAAQ